ncbi:uncharacterized protein LOC110914331 [Helianthus annuus]|uniref:uncharacterized protein LOC110914331 n=1 Tax=Helianthus annuus TaxID=4232 RepID=UPI000B8EEC7C|nr:uncharacterized protein LOC110914331 [Helianthus annuus]
MSGELKRDIFTTEDMYQVDPDDMEEMDLKWQMAMITLRLKKFQDKTEKRLSLGKAGFDKSKLRCYNCKNLGHFKRDCPLLKNENAETAPEKRPIAIEGNDNSTPNTPKALVVEDYDWEEEIAEATEQVNKALMAKISSNSASSSSSFVEKQDGGTPKGDKATDKGLKSILTPTERVADKGKEEDEKPELKKNAQEVASGTKKEKAEAPTAAMKAESAKKERG